MALALAGARVCVTRIGHRWYRRHGVVVFVGELGWRLVLFNGFKRVVLVHDDDLAVEDGW